MAQAQYSDTTIAGSFLADDGDDVLVGLTGCGDGDSLALFDRTGGQYIAYAAFPLDSCVKVPGDEGEPDRLACLDEQTLEDPTRRATMVRVVSFDSRPEVTLDRLVATYENPIDTCRAGTLTKNFQLQPGPELLFEEATVAIPGDQDACEWLAENPPSFTAKKVVLDLSASASVLGSAPDEVPADGSSFCEFNDLKNAIAGNRNGFERCFRDFGELYRNHGEMRLSFMLQPNGLVGFIGVDGYALKDAGLRHCMAKELRNVEFVRPNGGVCVVHYPFVLGEGDW